MNVDDKIVRMILETKSSNVNKIVIMPAVNLVMKKLVTKLENKRIHGRIYNGTLNGVQVSIIRSMIGCPHTAMTLECLTRSKAEIIIRVDLCGGIANENRNIEVGNIVIPPLAYCGDGTTPYYLMKYPELHEKIQFVSNPHPKFHQLQAGNQNVFNSNSNAELRNIYLEQGKNLFNGKIKEYDIWTTDAMFCETDDFIDNLRSFGIGAIDMESSILFLLGQLFNLKTISILSVSDIPGDSRYDMLKANLIHPELENGINNAIKLVIEGLPKVRALLGD